MPRLIGVSGAHGVGKTTLLHAICDAVGRERIELIVGISRSLIADGYGMGPSLTADSLARYYVVYRRLEAEALQTGKNVLVDRTLWDGLAYELANREIGHRTALSAELFELFTNLAREITGRFHCILYVPIEFPLVQDGVRPADSTYQQSVDKHLVMLLADATCPVHVVRGSLQDRLSVVERSYL